MSSKTRKPSVQGINLIISCLVSAIAFVFITLLARGLSNIGGTATLENLFNYCRDTQTLTLFGEVFPVSDFVLKLFSFPSASVEFTLRFFPPMTRELIYTFYDVFCEVLENFTLFIIKFITK